MIFTERTITVVNDSATINKPLILYRGDKNIELKITIAESQFKFRNTDASNVIETTDASYAQLVINTPYNSPIFSDVAATKNGAVIFVITEAMIDEIREVGAYEIQIRLLDDNKQSRASIPPVSNAIEIREPIAIEDGSAVDSNAVNTARVNRALTTTSAPLEVFDSQGNYIKKIWGDGDPITDAALNKMEAGIDGVNKKVASAGTGGTVDLSSYAKKEDVPTKTSQLTNDSGYITNIPDEYVTETELNAKRYATEQYVSGYVTKETGNANQITFADGQTFQAKLNAGTLKGEKGDTGEQGPAGTNGKDGLTTSISLNGVTYTQKNGVITLPNISSGGEVVLTPDTDSYRNDLFRANPAYPLNIKTHAEGKDQPTHPKVLYIKDKWNNYKYWMVYTPYPSNNNYLENPCIQASNNGYEWEVPSGLTNPIDSIPEDERGNFYSDPHILINSNNEMECWYRKCIYKQGYDDYGAEVIYRKKSTDGVTWTEKEEVYRHSSNNTYLNSVLSPSVIYDENKYKIWIIATENGKRKLKYYETATGSNWQFVRDIEINDPDGIYNMWHFDIIKSTEGYEFVGAYQHGLAFDKNNYIFYSKSDDNITYSTPIKILGVGYDGNFDDLELYRPCLIRKENELMMYYGAQKNKAIWHIGLLRFNNFTQLSDVLNGSSEILDLRNTLSKQQASINDLYAKINALSGSSEPTAGIVTDGLICCLDATDNSNTSPDRNIWKDSSGQVNNAELFNFTFDLSNSDTNRSNGWTGTSLKLGRAQNTYITVPVTNAVCIQMKIKLSILTSGGQGQYIMDGRNDIPNSFLVNTPATSSASSVGSIFNQKFYVNGVRKTSPHINMLTDNEFNNLYIESSSVMTGTLTFGAKSVDKGECGTFEIEKILIYDRALTESEFLQNQNAM